MSANAETTFHIDDGHMDENRASGLLKVIAASAMKRRPEPQEVANVALSLASGLSTLVAGQLIRVDGGVA